MSKGQFTNGKVLTRKLALGTAQFGMDYGIANQQGEVNLDEIEKILALAFSKGIRTLDTAVDYGKSEVKLGLVGIKKWHVVSKLPAVPDSKHSGDFVGTAVEKSLARLGVEQLHALLLHRPSQLLDENSTLYDSLQKLKARGLVKLIGVSVYETTELRGLLSQFEFDIVQVPKSIFDTRFEADGLLEMMKLKGIEVHSRSTFLQGLLLKGLDELPAKFAEWNKLWVGWERWLAENGIDALSACLANSLECQQIDRVLVGVDSLTQLVEILEATETSITGLSNLSVPLDSRLLNPSKWSLL